VNFVSQAITTENGNTIPIDHVREIILTATNKNATTQPGPSFGGGRGGPSRGPSGGGAGGSGRGGGPNPQQESMHQLLLMGYSEAQASEALQISSGNLQQAIDYLLNM